MVMSFKSPFCNNKICMNAVQEWLHEVVIKRLFMNEAGCNPVADCGKEGQCVWRAHKHRWLSQWLDADLLTHHIFNENTVVKNSIWKTNIRVQVWLEDLTSATRVHLPVSVTQKSINNNYTHKEKPHHIVARAEDSFSTYHSTDLHCSTQKYSIRPSVDHKINFCIFRHKSSILQQFCLFLISIDLLF